MTRPDGRIAAELRPVRIRRNFVSTAAGSCLVEFGQTRVICTASISQNVPQFLEGSDRGWITAEYAMLPASTGSRKPRGADGRATEIQRLIGRSLRAVAALDRMPGLTVTIDCDVLTADGGTRTASITGGYVALAEALWRHRKRLPDPVTQWPLVDSAAAISVGVVDGQCRLDLPYVEDCAAEVDMTVVMTGSGRLIEVQAAGEEHTFGRDDLAEMLDLAAKGCGHLTRCQRAAVSRGVPWPEKA